MIDERRFEKILDRMEDIASDLACTVCGNTLTQEEADQIEDGLELIRRAYIVNVERDSD